jgi:recombination protein RecA
MATKKKKAVPKVEEPKVEVAQPKAPTAPTTKKPKEKVGDAPKEMTREELVKSFQLMGPSMHKQFPDVFHAFLYEEEKLKTKRFSSGSIGMDIALGGGGLPYGRVIEFWGPEGGGKTSAALEIAWNFQRLTGKGVLIVDLERKLDENLLKNWKGVGFDPQLTVCVRPYTGEQVFEVIDYYLQNPAIGIIVLDSIAMVQGEKVLESDTQAVGFNSPAKIISENLPRLVGKSSFHEIPLIIVNQARIDMNNAQAKGRWKLRKTGGFKYGHCLDISFFVEPLRGKDNIITDGVRNYGHTCKMHVDKNHAGLTRFKSFPMRLYYGWGFDGTYEIVDMAIKMEIITVSGSWFSYEDLKSQGKDSFVDLVRAQPALEAKLKDAIMSTPVEKMNPSLFSVAGSGDSFEGAGIEIEISEEEAVFYNAQ